MSSTDKPYDPYDEAPPWWHKHTALLAALAVFLATLLLTLISFPPFRVPEFAYAFAVPAIFWAYQRPRFKLFAWTMLSANAIAWTLILSWLHHVTVGGLLLLGPIVGLWVGVWYLAVWWAMPRLVVRGSIERIFSIFGLAALWVLIEWTRTWFLSGFPWLPLSASQWERLSILQIAAFTGSWGISFVLIAVNLGFAAYAHRLLREGKSGLQRRSQEFFACLFLLIVCVTLHVQETFNRGAYVQPLGRISFVQPNIAQSLKWEEKEAEGILKILENTTLNAAKTRPDLILWPEAAAPYALSGDKAAQDWAEGLVKRSKTQILAGTLSIENKGTSKERWFNSVVALDPEKGLLPEHYSKQHLVPFGEYVPLRPVLGWLSKFVPVGDDFQAGEAPLLLRVPLLGRTVPFGSLICYEDIFPGLARQNVLAGAEVLFVATNSAWYGESPAAQQHLAHSVLRAVETRRPVLRCGNNGWSGWIDEFGTIRDQVENEDGSIFIRGSATFAIQRDSRWAKRQSFYVTHGDWFILVCFGLAVFAYYLLKLEKKQVPSDPSSEANGS